MTTVRLEQLTAEQGATVIMQKCRRHPHARFFATCPGCAQDLYDIAERNRQATAAKAHPLMAHIPAHQIAGLEQVVEVEAGLVTVVATPDSEWGAFEVISWRPRLDWEIDSDRLEFADALDEIPLCAYVTAATVQSADKIPAAVQYATDYLTERLAADTARAA